MLLPVTLAIAASCALINIWLALAATRRRLTGKIMMGDGGDDMMMARGRAHANFAEYAPFALILIALIELARGPSIWLWLIGALFVLARIAHPIGMVRPAPNPFRAGGAMVTWLVLIALAIWALTIAWQAERAAPALIDTVETVGPSA